MTAVQQGNEVQQSATHGALPALWVPVLVLVHVIAACILARVYLILHPTALRRRRGGVGTQKSHRLHRKHASGMPTPQERTPGSQALSHKIGRQSEPASAGVQEEGAGCYPIHVQQPRALSAAPCNPSVLALISSSPLRQQRPALGLSWRGIECSYATREGVKPVLHVSYW
jgi:hypothetical protein